MTFSSLAFLFVFFPIVFILYWICSGQLIRNVLLVVASLIFYAYGEPVAVFIMLISVLLNYVFGLMCSYERKPVRKKKKKAPSKKNCFRNHLGLFLAIVMNIGLLVVFKYSSFILDTIGLSQHRVSISLPIGISFFTFQGLSYVIDVYRNKKSVQRNLFSVMLYISFFPQLIAGPIVRYEDIKDQLVKREFNFDRVSSGLQRFAFGLGKKVLIAGPMGLMVDSIYSLDVASVGTLTAWAGAISYMLQIYFDFSGYSDMAIGLGRIFGFDFKENFDHPYSANSIRNFWRRWHISLSTWFKEYLYIPLGGNRKGAFRTYLNKFIVFLATGIWHGANLTFLCWGILHGVGLIIEDAVGKLFKAKPGRGASVVIAVIGRIYTLLFVMVAFIIFRADSLSTAGTMISKLVHASGSDAIALSHLTPVYLIALAFAIICSTDLWGKMSAKINVSLARLLSLAIYIASIVMLISGGYNPFIYFRF